MKSIVAAEILLGFCLVICMAVAVSSQSATSVKKHDKNVQTHAKLAKGTFEVKVTPMPAEADVGDPTIGRLSLAKQFSGGLTGSGKGQMLGVGTEVKDSGGYVVAERFTGTLDGKKGSFALQHVGTMQGGKYEMNVTVVPDSGTGKLVGISGKMKIIIENGKHFYEFEYYFDKPK